MAVGGAFPEKALIAQLTAKMLLEVEAIHFNAEKPFIFTSGWASPVYIDCRKLISYPRLRQTIIDFGASVLLRDAGFERFDAVAGGETAGIPFAAWMADRLMLPMQYVRKQPKGFGRDAQIEGHLEEGQRILLVEDLTNALVPFNCLDGTIIIEFSDSRKPNRLSISDDFIIGIS